MTLFLAFLYCICAGGCADTGTGGRGEKALNKTSVTLTEGGTVQLTLKNAPKDAAVKWSSSKKKVADVTQKGKVTAGKAGKAKTTASVQNRKYAGTVIVQKSNAVLTNTKGKNAADVKALEEIILFQNARGASL